MTLLPLVLLTPACASPSPPEITDIDDLRSEFEKAGGICLYWEQDNRVEDALQSGTCDSNTVLMFFSDRETAADRALELKNLIKSFDMVPNLLLGENWIINSPQVLEISENLTGVLIVN